MWFDGQRQPDTVYVASISRGKDSTAMLRAIQLLDFPLDMICSVDIWATEDIPAELPPMVAFKDEYDRKCQELFGIPVTRLYAQKHRSQIVNVERERERERTGQTAVLVLRFILYRMLHGTIRAAHLRIPSHNRRMVQETQNRIC